METIKNLFRQIANNSRVITELEPPMAFDSPMEVQVAVRGVLFTLLLERNIDGQLMLTKFITDTEDTTPAEFTIRALYEYDNPK